MKQILHDSTNVKYLRWSDSWNQSRTVVARSWREREWEMIVQRVYRLERGGTRSDCSIGIKFQLFKMSKVLEICYATLY